MKKHSLNEQTLKFILSFEKEVADEAIFTNMDLVEKYKQSTFHHMAFETYSPIAINKAIRYAVKRSGKWDMIKKGVYQKKKVSSCTETISPMIEAQSEISVDNNETIYTNFNREEYIRHLSKNLHEVLVLKKEISDEHLRKYHLSSKGIGDDLYYLTESYFRKKGIFRGKHSMSDFITSDAKRAIEFNVVSKNLIYEHMIPKNFYIKQISDITLAGELNEAFIFDLLIKYYFVCTVTKEEDSKLPSIKMDDDWDGINPFYRYEKAGIEFFPNR